MGRRIWTKMSDKGTDRLLAHIDEWKNVEVIPAYNDSNYYTAEEPIVCSKCKSKIKFKVNAKMVQMHEITCPICNNVDKKVVLNINIS